MVETSGALARVGVVHVMHGEARAVPDRWGLPIPSCLLRSGNTSLTGSVRSMAAMGRDPEQSGGMICSYPCVLHLHHLVPVAASRS